MNNKNPKVLVTGATGYIGSKLVFALLALDQDVTVLVRNSDKAKNLFGNRVNYHSADLGQPNAFANLGHDFKYIFHLGAAVSYRLPEKSSYYAVNEGGTKQLVAFAEKQTNLQKLVYVSSVGVYGPIAFPPATEETPYNPENDYEISKKTAEKIVTATQLPYVVIQPTLVYGPGDTASGMYRLFMAAMSGKFISIGSKPVLMHPVHIDNLLQALLKAAYSPIEKEVFIIGDSTSTPLAKLAQQISLAAKAKLLPISLPIWIAVILGYIGDILAKFGLPAPISSGTVHFMTHHRAFSIAKATEKLGYKPTVSISSGINQTVSWYQNNS